MTTVSITYADVKRDLRRMSEYVGMKSGAFDRVRAIDSDDEQLRYWYADGVSTASVLLDGLLARRTVTDPATGVTVFSLQTANASVDLLPGALRRVVAGHMLTRWLTLVAPALVEAHTAHLAQQRDELVALAYRREMPR